MNVTQVLSELDAAEFDPWNTDARGAETLNAVGDEIRAQKLRSCFEDVFRFMERLETCDLGSPGPLVHALEAVGDYQTELFASLSRKPTPLTLWMLNRIINVATAEEKSSLIERMKVCGEHDQASEAAKREAIGFLEYQIGNQ